MKNIAVSIAGILTFITAMQTAKAQTAAVKNPFTLVYDGALTYRATGSPSM